MKVILEFKHAGDQSIDLLKNSRAWLSEYGLKVEEKLSKDNESTYWMIDPDLNKNIQFLFIVEDENEIPVNMNKSLNSMDLNENNNNLRENEEELFFNNNNFLEKSESDFNNKLDENLVEAEYDDNVRSILKYISNNMKNLNDGIYKILNNLDKIKSNHNQNNSDNMKNDIIDKYNEFKNMLDLNDDEYMSYDSFLSNGVADFEDEMSEDEILYRNEIIQRISELNGPDYKLHLIDILLEYIDDQKIDKASYKKMTEMND